jgi:hypothetical protein
MTKDTAEVVDIHYSKGFFDAIRTAWLAAKDAGVNKVFIVVSESAARVY